MSKTLVLAEKPSVGRDLARVLNCHKKGNGYLEGNKYIVTWALGHLVTLADPEGYGKQYASWRMEDLPMLPQNFKLVVIQKTGKQFNVVKTQMNRKDVKEIVIATDAGREGELVARWIIEKAGVRKPLKRLWISSVTDKAIKDGFNNLKDGREYENLYQSAISRAEADWIVGINVTRALTCKHNAQLSSGRVQTPTLAIIQSREEEIKNFKARKFYGLVANSEKLSLTWQDKESKNTRTFDEAKSDKLLVKLKNKDAKVIEVNKNYKRTYAPRLYDLTELQRDANKFFSFSAKETLSIMQKLYEQHKLLTYPRTDSRYLTSDIVPTLPERIKACGVGDYSRFGAKILKTPIKASRSFVDDSKVSDHHAIIPTEQVVLPGILNNNERKIYDLVIKRFFAVLYPPFEYEETIIKAAIDSEIFMAKGKNILKDGWKEIYQKEEVEEMIDEYGEQRLPKIDKGDILKIKKLVKTQGETKAPPYFDEGNLLSAMENPKKYMASENKDLIKTISESGGLGTVATRADVIEKLFNSFLLEKKGKYIHLTSKGRQLLDLVPEDLKKPALTAELEQKLDSIAKGKLDKNKFIVEMKEYTKKAITEIKNTQQEFKHDNIIMVRCDECGKPMLEVNNKRGKMLVCQDRECGFRKNISQTTNARCPNCRKRLELRGEGDGKIFVCPCGFKEKLDAFNKRKEKQAKTRVSKKDVSKYIGKQDEELSNPALAEALKKLKLD